MRNLKFSLAPLPPDIQAQALAVLAELRTTHPFPMEVLGIPEEQFFLSF